MIELMGIDSPRTAGRKISASRKSMQAVRNALRSVHEKYGSDYKIRDFYSEIAIAAKEIGVGSSTVNRAKYIFENGTAEDIEAVELGRASVFPVAKRIKTEISNNLSISEAPENLGGKVGLVAGETVESTYRKIAQECEDRGEFGHNVAPKYNWSHHTYRAARDIVGVYDRSDLTKNHREIANTALAHMNENRSVTWAHRQIKDIADMIWGCPRGREEKKLAIFDRAFGQAMQACAAIEELPIPYFSDEITERHIKEISKAQSSLRKFKKEMKEKRL